MWILDFLPAWIIHLTVLIGAVGVLASWVLNFLPFVATYRLTIQVASILLLAFGLYAEGGLSNQAKWELRVAQAEKKVLVAEAKAEEATRKLTESILKSEQEIKQITINNISQLRNIAAKIDQQCKVDIEAINILNNAAKNKK